MYTRLLSATDENLVNELLAMRRQVLLQPYVDLVTSDLMSRRAGKLTDMHELNERVMHFAPLNSVVYREVILLAMSGEQAAAQLLLECAIWAWPEGLPAALEQLRLHAQEDPAHFTALLEFAPKKYEERQLANHSR